MPIWGSRMTEDWAETVMHHVCTECAQAVHRNVTDPAASGDLFSKECE